MFVSCTKVRVERFGESRPVEDIRVGDCVFDVLSNRQKKVTQVLSQDVPSFETQKQPDDARKPVLIRRGSLGDSRPNTDVFFSPQHEILQALPLPNCSQRLCLQPLAAETLAEPLSPAESVLVYGKRFFAIFTEGQSWVETPGLLSCTLTQDSVFRGLAAHSPPQRGLNSPAASMFSRKTGR